MRSDRDRVTPGPYLEGFLAPFAVYLSPILVVGPVMGVCRGSSYHKSKKRVAAEEQQTGLPLTSEHGAEHRYVLSLAIKRRTVRYGTAKQIANAAYGPAREAASRTTPCWLPQKTISSGRSSERP